jgi:hypothetical protein
MEKKCCSAKKMHYYFCAVFSGFHCISKKVRTCKEPNCIIVGILCVCVCVCTMGLAGLTFGSMI